MSAHNYRLFGGPFDGGTYLSKDDIVDPTAIYGRDVPEWTPAYPDTKGIYEPDSRGDLHYVWPSPRLKATKRTP